MPAWAGFAVAAGGVGFGVWLVVLGLRPARPPLAAVLAAATAPPPAHPAQGPGSSDAAGSWSGSWLRVVGLPVARRLQRWGLPGARVSADLRVTGQPAIAHLALSVTAALVGLLAPALLSVPLALAGVGALPAWLWLVGAAAGGLLPAVNVRAAATRRRAELRRAISAVLDLTAIALAGGAGVEQALTGAAAVGRGWAHDRIRGALHHAWNTRTDPWVALGRLGTDLRVEQLTELAATLGLAGAEGARVRASLTAKARALRTHQQTDDEAAAASATERMSLPVIVLFAAYLVFIGYPALARVLAL
ncbi:type II secretion system F family protein [Pseudonocardia sp.]|uniref:type II secretion system F family protein n=1 Tax=Pseudonocardia sp. TaxID=60912 RepID=UPI003D14F025